MESDSIRSNRKEFSRILNENIETLLKQSEIASVKTVSPVLDQWSVSRY